MRHTAKYLSVLLLGSVLGGCSMAGSGDYFADDYAEMQRTQMPHYFGTPKNDCPAPYYPAQPTPYQAQPNPCGGPIATPDSHSYGHAVQGQYGQNPYAQYGHTPYGHNPYGQGGAYGQNTPYGQGAYVPPTYGRNQNGLRGKSNGFKSHAYGTLGVVNYEAGEDLYGAQARIGYQFNKYLGAEAEGSLGVSSVEDQEVFGGTPVDQKFAIDNSAAAFGVLRYPLFGKVSGYSRLGYHQTELERKLTIGAADPEKQKSSVNGIAYGSGLEYEINPRTAVRLDYTVYDYDGPDADAVSLAVSRKF